MKNEGLREEPKIDDIKLLPSQMENQINLLSKKMEAIKKLDDDVALAENDGTIQSLHEKMLKQVDQTKASLMQLETDLIEKQK